MFEEAIINAVKAFDEEVTDVRIEDTSVTITYTDGDKYTGTIRVDGSTILLDFHRTFIIRVNLTVEM